MHPEFDINIKFERSIKQYWTKKSNDAILITHRINTVTAVKVTFEAQIKTLTGKQIQLENELDFSDEITSLKDKLLEKEGKYYLLQFDVLKSDKDAIRIVQHFGTYIWYGYVQYIRQIERAIEIKKVIEETNVKETKCIVFIALVAPLLTKQELTDEAKILKQAKENSEKAAGQLKRLLTSAKNIKNNHNFDEGILHEVTAAIDTKYDELKVTLKNVKRLDDILIQQQFELFFAALNFICIEKAENIYAILRLEDENIISK